MCVVVECCKKDHVLREIGSNSAPMFLDLILDLVIWEKVVWDERERVCGLGHISDMGERSIRESGMG